MLGIPGLEAIASLYGRGRITASVRHDFSYLPFFNPLDHGRVSDLQLPACSGVIGQTTTTKPLTTTTTGNGISTPTPTQPGMTPSCDRFYFVQSGDGCAAIANKYNISLNQFYAWNTGVGSSCESLWANTLYVCMHSSESVGEGVANTGP